MERLKGIPYTSGSQVPFNQEIGIRSFSFVIPRCAFPFVIALLSTVYTVRSQAQEGVALFGLQFRPMIPSSFFGIEEERVVDGDLSVNFDPQFGYNFGMVVRYGVSKMTSFETGINLVQRNYRLAIEHPDLPGPQDLSFRFVGYEIPVQGQIFVQLGKQLWMNASGGISLDIYPSNVESFGEARKDTLVFDLYQKTWRNGRAQLALLANYGFEWRTKESGFFYVGISYHRPFNKIGYTDVEVREKLNVYRLDHMLSGNYLTLDFRYFFHEEPEKRKK